MNLPLNYQSNEENMSVDILLSFILIRLHPSLPIALAHCQKTCRLRFCVAVHGLKHV